MLAFVMVIALQNLGGSIEQPANNLLASTRRSELKFESLSLKAVPEEQVCSRNSSSETSLINVLSFANNQISSIEPKTFACLGLSLKILILSYNSIEFIRRDAFDQLESVQVLLLENNLLTMVPSKDVLAPMKSLRHLNLANNQIELLPSDSFAASSSNLISLNLKGNPLKRIASDSLLQLNRLKTLTLSQALLKGQMVALAGLKELRFLHLDRNANLHSMEEQWCQRSSKLSTLILKSNQFREIPSLKECHNLLLLDLSYNGISGSLSRNFSQFPELIDLYLGFNQINSISEDAFAGLARLQVLDLSNNQLTFVHPLAFSGKIKSTLYDLNISNNRDLAHFRLAEDALDRLVSLNAFGNPQVRELPKFRSATVLALTYAYHCCDYLGPDSRLDLTVPEEPIVYKLADSLRLALEMLLGMNSSSVVRERLPVGEQEGKEAKFSDKIDENISELIIWPIAATRSVAGIDLGKERRSRHSGSRSERRRRRSGDFEAAVSLEELFMELTKVRKSKGLVGWSGENKGEQQVREVVQGDAIDWKLTVPLRWLEKLSSRTRRTLKGMGSEQRQVRAGVSCRPSPSALLPCNDLFDSWWLRAGVWFVFLCSFSGNILVIFVLCSVKQSSSTSALTSIMWLAHSKRHIDVPRFLVINLAVADLLMALYLGILATVDASTLGEFRVFAIKWQYSSGCKLAGFLGVLSSELSVFILAVITLERKYAITNAVHLNRRLSLQKAVLVMLLGYLFALAMAMMPLNGISDYRRYSICLPLDVETSLASQMYVLSLLCINTFSFLLLLGCYLRMYFAIRGSQAWNANDLKIAKRMSILVATDFLCWSPIIVSAMASLFGYYLIGTRGLKVLTIFVLPLNSVANPFLYAIATKKFKRDLNLLLGRVKTITALNYCANHCRFRSGCLQQQSHKQDFDTFRKHKHLLSYQSNRNKLLDYRLAGDSRQRTPVLAMKIKEADLLHVELNSRERRFRGTGRSRRHRDQETAPSGPVTGNQVTVNKTTCASCQQHLDLRTNSKRMAESTYQERRPRIMLETAIEPALKVAFASCGLTQRSASSTALADCFEDQANGSSPPLGSHNLKNSSPRRDSARVHISVSPNALPGSHHDTLQPHIRSASACGYRREPSVYRRNRKACNTITGGSYDPIVRAESKLSRSFREKMGTKSKEKVFSSISRLLISPIASAWSSIQISLGSPNNQEQPSFLVTNWKSAALHEDELSSVDSSLDGYLPCFQQSDRQAIMEEMVLQDSSETRLLLRSAKERRMSRSCELISTHQPLFSQTNSSPLAEHQPSLITSSLSATQADQENDKRVLLATLNQIATNRDRPLVSRIYHSNEIHPFSGSNRCRSWSPAFLTKLEDCFKQIKSKIPRLSTVKSDAQATEGVNEATSDTRNTHLSSSEHSDADSNLEQSSIRHDEDQKSQKSLSYRATLGDNESLRSLPGDNGVEETMVSSTSDNQFEMTRLAKSRKSQLAKLYNYTSVNSDTFSTKTEGTLLISLSLDSNHSNKANRTMPRSDSEAALNRGA